MKLVILQTVTVFDGLCDLQYTDTCIVKYLRDGVINEITK